MRRRRRAAPSLPTLPRTLPLTLRRAPGWRPLPRREPGRLPPPVDDIAAVLTPQQIESARSRLTYSAVGGPETVQKQLSDFIALTQVDELMITGMMFDKAARIRSLEIVAEARERLAA